MELNKFLRIIFIHKTQKSLLDFLFSRGEIMQRDTRLDVIKTIACFCVVVIHICSYTSTVGSINWYGNVFWRALCGAAVPLFLMCSGALFLQPKPLSLKKLYLKNLLRVLVAGFAWAFVYKIHHICVAGTLTPSLLWQAIKEVLLFQHEFHLYYIQIVLVLYIGMPVLRVIAVHATRREILYALAVWFVFGIVYPSVIVFWPFRLLGGVANLWILNMIYAAFGYALLGYYLYAYPISLRASLGAVLAGFLITFVSTVVGSLKTGVLYEQFLSGMSVGCALLAAGIYGSCLHIKRTLPAAVYVSKASFLVYLAHMLWINFLKDNLHITADCFSAWLSVPILAIGTIAVCTGLYFVLSHIPVVKKWLI